MKKLTFLTFISFFATNYGMQQQEAGQSANRIAVLIPSEHLTAHNELVNKYNSRLKLNSIEALSTLSESTTMEEANQNLHSIRKQLALVKESWIDSSENRQEKAQLLRNLEKCESNESMIVIRMIHPSQSAPSTRNQKCNNQLKFFEQKLQSIREAQEEIAKAASAKGDWDAKSKHEYKAFDREAKAFIIGIRSFGKGK